MTDAFGTPITYRGHAAYFIEWASDTHIVIAWWSLKGERITVPLTSVRLRSVERKLKKRHRRRDQYPHDQASTSVRTVSGGLPERNRRTH